MKTDIVIFEITDREIRALKVSLPLLPKSLRHCTQVKFDCVPISTGIIEQGNIRDPKALLNALRIYKLKHSRKSLKAYLAIPIQQGFIRAYRLPWLPKRDRQSAISLLVDEEISLAKSEIIYDFYVLAEEKHKNLEILLGATRQNLLDEYVDIFSQAGFEVMGIDFALAVLGQALGFESKGDVLYLQGDVEGVQMALFRGTIPEIGRTLQPQKLQLPLAEEIRLNIRTQAAEQMAEWGNEISRFLLYYRTQYPDLNLSRLVWSGNEIAEQLAQRLLLSNQVSAIEQAQISRPADFCRNVLEEYEGCCEAVIGYALRIFADSPGLNLWHRPNLEKAARRKLNGLAGFSAALFIMAALLWLLLWHITSPLANEVKELSRRGERINGEASRQLDIETAWNKVRADADNVGQNLAQIQALSNGGTKIDKVTYKQGSITLRGSVKDVKEINFLLNSLGNNGWAETVLTSYKADSSDNIKYSISAKRKDFSDR